VINSLLGLNAPENKKGFDSVETFIIRRKNQHFVQQQDSHPVVFGE
jgi:hypothetical protein